MKPEKTIRIVAGALLIAAVIVAVIYRHRFTADTLEHWFARAGAWAPAAFLALYVVWTALMLPGTVLSVTAGVLFGPVWGAFYTLAGAMLGAVAAFLIARSLASEWVAEKLGGRMDMLMNGIDSEGWKFVAFVRLVPLFPFNLLNYALGLTRIKLSHYTITSFFCMIPGAIAYTYVGHAGREAIEGRGGVVQKALLAVGMLAVMGVGSYVVRRMREGRK